MRPLGLSATYQSCFCSRLVSDIGVTLYGSPSSSSRIATFQPFGVSDVSSSSIDFSPVRPDEAKSRVRGKVSAGAIIGCDSLGAHTVTPADSIATRLATPNTRRHQFRQRAIARPEIGRAPDVDPVQLRPCGEFIE